MGTGPIYVAARAANSALWFAVCLNALHDACDKGTAAQLVPQQRIPFSVVKCQTVLGQSHGDGGQGVNGFACQQNLFEVTRLRDFELTNNAVPKCEAMFFQWAGGSR